jgi:hypothetical protein
MLEFLGRADPHLYHAADSSATANFVLGNSYTLSVNKTGDGSGTVISSPTGITCVLPITHRLTQNRFNYQTIRLPTTQ